MTTILTEQQLVINLNSDSTSDDEESEEESSIQHLQRASNGLEWSSHAPHGNVGRSRRENVIRENPGPKRGIHPI